MKVKLKGIKNNCEQKNSQAKNFGYFALGYIKSILDELLWLWIFRTWLFYVAMDD